MEQRNSQIRHITDESEGIGEGIIEGHFVTWDKTDSYNSMFKKGSFKNTIQQKGLQKIRMLWNHESGFNGPLTIIGKPIEIKEDDTGVFIRAQLITDLPAGANAWRLIKEGIINTLSFGFTVINQAYEKGIRVISEVELYEFSTVAFEANPDATITSMRNSSFTRATDFDETLSNKELAHKMALLSYALDNTLSDIWWNTSNRDEIPVLLDKALDAFKMSYMDFAVKYLEFFANDPDLRPTSSTLAEQLQRCCNGRTIQEIAQETLFTLAELRQLQRGGTISQPERLKTLSEDLFREHQKNNVDEDLLTGIRNLRHQGY